MFCSVQVDTVPSRPRSPTARVVLTAAVHLLREERTISSPPTQDTTSSSRLPAQLQGFKIMWRHI